MPAEDLKRPSSVSWREVKTGLFVHLIDSFAVENSRLECFKTELQFNMSSFMHPISVCAN